MAGPRGAERATPVRGNETGWTPSLINLLVLVALEIAGYVALRWAFRTAHGG